jgi:hypothetical protein
VDGDLGTGSHVPQRIPCETPEVAQVIGADFRMDV